MINILFGGSYGVFDGMLTCMLSIFHRSQNTEPIIVHIFTMDVSDLNPKYKPVSKEQFETLNLVVKKYNENNVVKLYDVTSLYNKFFRGCPNEGAYCSPFTLIRLFIDLVNDIPDKLLYLDSDIMFNRDIHLLYDIDVSEVEYAAAPDHYGKYLVNPHYINAGVLLLNVKKMKETGIFEKARGLIMSTRLKFADQSALIRSTTKRKILPQKFNDQKFLHKHTVVRHFSQRLFYFPYPHVANIKQYQLDKVHKVFHYYQFDDIYQEYKSIKNHFGI